MSVGTSKTVLADHMVQREVASIMSPVPFRATKPQKPVKGSYGDHSIDLGGSSTYPRAQDRGRGSYSHATQITTRKPRPSVIIDHVKCQTPCLLVLFRRPSKYLSDLSVAHSLTHLLSGTTSTSVVA